MLAQGAVFLSFEANELRRVLKLVSTDILPWNISEGRAMGLTRFAHAPPLTRPCLPGASSFRRLFNVFSSCFHRLESMKTRSALDEFTLKSESWAEAVPERSRGSPGGSTRYFFYLIHLSEHSTFIWRQTFKHVDTLI